MAAEKGSAEKDLLKIIENPSALEEKKKSFQGLKGEDAFGGRKARPVTKGPAGGKGAAKSPFNPRTLLQAQNLNRILIGITVLVIINFIYAFWAESSRSNRAESFIENITRQISLGKGVPKTPTESVSGEPSVKPEPVLSRNLFGQKPVELPEAKKTSVYADILKNYKLVGISLGKTAEDSYAMIENADTQITHFLKKGDELGGVKVLDIKTDKVVLDVQGNTTDLR